MPLTTVTALNNGAAGFRDGNLGGYTDWGLTFVSGVVCDNTYVYSLLSNATSASINGGNSECHLLRTPWATWTVAGTTILASFTRTTGGAAAFNALSRRPSDGLLACRLPGGDLFTFDPAAGYVANRLGWGGADQPSAQQLGIAFDPDDGTLLWHAGSFQVPRQWRIGVGDLGNSVQVPTPLFYGCQPAGSGYLVGPAGFLEVASTNAIIVVRTSDGLARYPAGMRWLDTDRNGAGNNDRSANVADRGALTFVTDVCRGPDGTFYIYSGTSAAFSIRTVSPDWLTVGAISTAAYGSNANIAYGRISCSPDGTKLVYSRAESLVKVT